MKPGRELDALVAWKVMRKQAGVLDIDDPIFGEMDDFRGKGPPHYSTDIAAAWELVEKLDMLDGRALFKEEVMHNTVRWVVAEHVGGREFDRLVSEAETAPHAICLAALDVVNAL